MLYVVSSRERYSNKFRTSYLLPMGQLFLTLYHRTDWKGRGKSRLVSWCQPSDLLCWLTVIWPGAPNNWFLGGGIRVHSVILFLVFCTWILNCPQDQPFWDNERGHWCLLPHREELPGRAGVSDIHLCWVRSFLHKFIRMTLFLYHFLFVNISYIFFFLSACLYCIKD